VADRDRKAAERLGQAIQVRRAELGMKRRELAAGAELSYPYVSEIENGMKDPSARALHALAEALGLTPGELFARAEDLRDVTAVRRRPENRVAANDTTGTQPEAGDPAGLVTHSALHAPTLEPSGLGHTADRLIAEAVEAAMAQWARTQLPRLVQQEVTRALGETTSGTSN
jgi:transcriptional regulator with XRE-family HTH domain